jgi:hypothetical protein
VVVGERGIGDVRIDVAGIRCSGKGRRANSGARVGEDARGCPVFLHGPQFGKIPVAEFAVAAARRSIGVVGTVADMAGTRLL